MRRWQIGSQVPLLHIGPCSPFSLTRAARNLESLPHGPSLKLYFMTEVIQFPITSSTPSLTQKERFPMWCSAYSEGGACLEIDN